LQLKHRFTFKFDGNGDPRVLRSVARLGQLFERLDRRDYSDLVERFFIEFISSRPASRHKTPGDCTIRRDLEHHTLYCKIPVRFGRDETSNPQAIEKALSLQLRKAFDSIVRKLRQSGLVWLEWSFVQDTGELLNLYELELDMPERQIGDKGNSVSPPHVEVAPTQIRPHYSSSVPHRFFTACGAGRVETVEKYLDGGVSPTARDENDLTGLMLASRAGRCRVAGLMLRRGALLEEVDSCGRTAFFHAVMFARLRMIAFLAAAGASVNPRDGFGITPLDFAMGDSPRNSRLMALLLRLGAEGAGAPPRARTDANA